MTVLADKKRILALSKDRGSVQAIVPVVAELGVHLQLTVKLVSPAGCHALPAAWGLVSDTLDEGAFAADPEAYMAKVFDEIEPQLLLSGSSPARGITPETPEQFAIREAHRRRIPSVAVLDYWGMYKERFGASDGSIDVTLLPDRLCVLDRRCRDDLQQLGVPIERMVVTHNPWMDGVIRQALDPPPPSDLLSNKGWRVLFVSQPLSGWLLPNQQPPQHELLAALVSALPRAGDERHRVLVWKHPAEEEDRWEDVGRFSSDDVEVLVTGERGAAILAHVDIVASVHSTIAYEALHYGTPSLSLRCGVAYLPRSFIDELGLSKLIVTDDEMRSFLGSADPQTLRMLLRARKRRLCEEGVFFSDGKATSRVVVEVLRLVTVPAGSSINS